MSGYNDKLDADDQVTMEEQIASYIFEDFDPGDDYAERERWPNEEECAEMGRQILLMVLEKFRPDLVE